MGMTIENAIKHGQEQLEVFGGEHREFIETSLDTMRKYQMFQDQSLSLYMERLKADMVAMLTELQLEIEEMKSYESPDGQDLVMLADIGILFQQIINALRGDDNECI